MRALTASLTDEQIALLGNELERLFIRQDKHLSKQAKGVLVQDLTDARLPYGAIMAALHKLGAEDLRTIKISTILGAAADFLIADPEEKKSCGTCTQGVVVMRDAESGAWSSLACTCTSGDDAFRRLGIERWKGELTQIVRGGRLLKLFELGRDQVDDTCTAS